MQSKRDQFKEEAKIGALRSCIKELTGKFAMGLASEVDRKQIFTFKRQLAKLQRQKVILSYPKLS